MQLQEKFNQECKRDQSWNTETNLVVAVSGGVDSMSLLSLILNLPQNLRPQVVVAHINHQLRPISAKEEAELSLWCKKRDVPFYSKKWSKKKHPQAGMEEAARAFRYDFFEEIMLQTNAQFLVTAHHRADQVETILMRFVRGGQFNRLTGINRIRSFNRGKLIRPLLNYTKEELYEYANHQELMYFEDETNISGSYTRNRYRNTIIPLIKQENPNVEEHIVQFAQDLQDVLELVSPIVKEALEECHAVENGQEKLLLPRFEKHSPALQRQILLYLLNDYYKRENRTFKSSQIEQIRRWLIQSGPNSQVDFPGSLIIQKSYEWAYFKKHTAAIGYGKKVENYEMTLNLDETISLPNGGKMGLYSSEESMLPASPFSHSIYVNPEDIILPLTVRNRRTGDRMSLKGKETGTKKVKKIFIDKKIPVEKRERVPIVTDKNGIILWVAGIKESALSIQPETDTIHYILHYEAKRSDS
ncbi:tRNA lysidine(34) synthetase TilS [Lacticigenium naphthae]|uniref:tRNA lysidine(34) synthetase TilS n=1 Tax=Lacticigenium naphthae TaxID=515351 RepID=UPI0004242176|nr:tRNA lysidine(34) synthetase TilS [Lacticigenium naphthae]